MREQDDAGLDPVEGAGSASSATEVRWAVGAVSRRLGIATPTLRSWDRRYHLGPSVRTDGGHRRYSELDVGRVARMSQLITEGVPPARAAQVALDSRPDLGAARWQLVYGPVGDVAGGDEDVATTVGAMLRATRALDSATLCTILAQVVDRRGVLVGWTEVVVPFLVSVGTEWADGSLGVEGEHLASECIQGELQHRLRHRYGRAPADPSVLLASPAGEQHALPLVALAAALVERRVGARTLGGCTPAAALAAAVERVSPRVLFLWSSTSGTGDVARLAAVAAVDPTLVLLLGGPGWGSPGGPPWHGARVERVHDLQATVDRVCDLVA